jgi:hypothetical protein
MADKSPRKANGKKAGKTLKEKRSAKKLKRSTTASPFDATEHRRR